MHSKTLQPDMSMLLCLQQIIYKKTMSMLPLLNANVLSMGFCIPVGSPGLAQWGV